MWCLLVLHLVAFLTLVDSRQDAAIVYLADGSPARLADLRLSLQRLDQHFNNRYRYPVVIFHAIDGTDPSNALDFPLLTVEHQHSLQEATESNLIFAPIRLAGYVEPQVLLEAPHVLHGRFTFGYRHMCNFFAGPVANDPYLAPYRYYWRFDTDSFLMTSVGYDVFDAMAGNSWRYGWATKQCDWHAVTDGLFETVERVYGPGLAAKLEPDMLDGTCNPERNAVAKPYNSRIYYNNFEIVDLDWMRSAAYQAGYRAIVAAKGIYTHRWGDAPIRTLIARALLPHTAIHRFDDIDYWHQNLYGPVARFLVATAICAAVGAAVYLLVWYCRRRQQSRLVLLPLMLVRGLAANPYAMVAARWVRVLLNIVFCTRLDVIWRVMPKLPSLRLRRSPSSASYSRLLPLHQQPHHVPHADASAGGAEAGTGGTHNGGKAAAAGGDALPSSAAATMPLEQDGGLRTRWLLVLTAIVAVAGLSLSRTRHELPLAQQQPTPCRIDDLDCMLAHRSNHRREIVVTAANKGSLPFLLNLLASWRSIALTDHYLVFALDPDAASYLSTHGVAVYWDPAPIAKLNMCRWKKVAGRYYVPRPAAAAAGGAGPTASAAASAAASTPLGQSTFDYVECRDDDELSDLPGLSEGLSSTPIADSAAGNFRFNTAGFITATQRKNEVVYEVIRRGYTSFFTDADTVWRANLIDDDAMRGRYLSQGCTNLRLGDTTNFEGDMPGHIQGRADCGGLLEKFPRSPAGVAAGFAIDPRSGLPVAGSDEGLLLEYPYDVKGMYGEWRQAKVMEAASIVSGTSSDALSPLTPRPTVSRVHAGDTGGLDTGLWYMRNTTASIDHMIGVIGFQILDPRARVMNDQDTFNKLLEPWDAEAARKAEAAVTSTDSSSSSLDRGVTYAAETMEETGVIAARDVSSIGGFGPSRMRVALFNPLDAPTGCRLPRAWKEQEEKQGGAGVGHFVIVGHANCREGYWQKAWLLSRYGMWHVGWWEDGSVWRVVAALLAWIGVRKALLVRRAMIDAGHHWSSLSPASWVALIRFCSARTFLAGGGGGGPSSKVQ